MLQLCFNLNFELAKPFLSLLNYYHNIITSHASNGMEYLLKYFGIKIIPLINSLIIAHS